MAKEIDCRLRINRDLKSCKGKQLIVEKSKKKPLRLPQGTASLFIGLLSLAFASITFFKKPAPIPIENMSVFGGGGVIYISIISIFIFISLISFIIYFIRRSKR